MKPIALNLRLVATRQLVFGSVTSTLLLAALVLGQPAAASQEPPLSPPVGAGNSSALIYTRLKYEKNYQPIFRGLQKSTPFYEQPIRLVAPAQDAAEQAPSNGSHVGANTTTSIYTYYVNPHYNLSALTEDGLILEALDQAYQSRIMQPYMQNYDRPEDRRRSSDPRKVSASRCKRELDYVMQQLARIREAHDSRQPVRGLNPELATYFDSFATQEAGLLVGHYFWLGDWRQCTMRHIFDLQGVNGNPSSEAPISFSGRYCVASIRSPAWEQAILEKARELREMNFYTYPENEFDYKRYFRIQLGICLPESCDSSIIDSRSADVRRLAVHRLSYPLNTYNLTDLFCVPDESSPLRWPDLSGWAFIGLSTGWLLCQGLASLADHYDWVGLRSMKHKEKKSLVQRLVLAMSVPESWRKFVLVQRRKETPPTSTPPPPQPAATSSGAAGGEEDSSTAFSANGPLLPPADTAAVKPAHKSSPVSSQELAFIDAIKSLIMPGIMFGHVGMMTQQNCRYPLNFDTVNPFMYHFAAGATFFVDWFFCITGFITVYVMFAQKTVQTNTARQWFYTVFHRYWRLAPPYVLFFWFNRSLYALTASGPIWDYGTSTMGMRANCQRESWLMPLTLTQNFQPLHRECVLPAWYIANDMQFYLFTPFLLVLLNKSPRTGWLVAICIMLTSLTARIWRLLTVPLFRPEELLHPRYDLVMRNNWDYPYTYLQPHYRVSSYLIGVLAGHYCYMVRSGQWSSFLHGAGDADHSSKGAGQQAGPVGWRSFPGWLGLCTATIMCWATLELNSVFPQALSPTDSRLFAAFIYGSMHTVVASSIATVLVSIMLGQWKRARAFMERPIWTYVSRINFFVYLYQIELIVWVNNSADHVNDMTSSDGLRVLGMVMPTIYLVALVATILLVSPLNRLEAEFVGTRFFPPKQKKQPQATEAPQLKLVVLGTPSADCVVPEEEQVVDSASEGCKVNNSSSSSNNNNRSSGPTTNVAPPEGAKRLQEC